MPENDAFEKITMPDKFFQFLSIKSDMGGVFPKISTSRCIQLYKHTVILMAHDEILYEHLKKDISNMRKSLGKKE